MKCLVLIVILNLIIDKKESREWCQIIEAVVDNVGELAPEQRHDRWDVGGHTG